MANDMKMTSMMPDRLKSVMFSSLAVSRTGNAGKYQGGDACLEEINKEAKSWMSGVPTDQQWTRVFHNLDKLNKVCISYTSTTKLLQCTIIDFIVQLSGILYMLLLKLLYHIRI